MAQVIQSPLMRAMMLLVLIGCGDSSSEPTGTDASASTASHADAASDAPSQLEACPGVEVDLPGLTCNAHGLCSWEHGQCCTIPLPDVPPDPRCVGWKS